MKKRSTLLIFIGFLCLSTTYAQYNKGYIVTLDNDTVAGFIRSLPDIEYSKSIQFKPKRTGRASIIFNADEIDGFFILPNLYFQSFPSPMPMDSLSHLFMERLFYGRLSMYLLDLSSIPLYFVQKSGGALMQLVEKRNSHRELLKNLTTDCEVGIFPETFPLSSGSLIRFARRYEAEMQKQKVQKIRN